MEDEIASERESERPLLRRRRTRRTQEASAVLQGIINFTPTAAPSLPNSPSLSLSDIALPPRSRETVRRKAKASLMLICSER